MYGIEWIAYAYLWLNRKNWSQNTFKVMSVFMFIQVFASISVYGFIGTDEESATKFAASIVNGCVAEGNCQLMMYSVVLIMIFIIFFDTMVIIEAVNILYKRIK